VWRKLAGVVMPHRAQLLLAQGQDPNKSDWHAIVQGNYHRTKSLLRGKLSPRILTLDFPSGGHYPSSQTAPSDRLLLKSYSEVHLLDTSRSCERNAKAISSWILPGRMIYWEAFLDEETLVVGCSDFLARQTKTQHIAARIFQSWIFPSFADQLYDQVLKAGSEEATKFAVDIGTQNELGAWSQDFNDASHNPSGALSCNKTRLITFPNTIVDLERKCAIAKMAMREQIPAFVKGAVAASPFNPNIFLSLAGKLRVVDIRLPTVNGSVEPVQTLKLLNRSWNFVGASIDMKDEHLVWMGYECLLQVDLRSGSTQKYSAFGPSETTAIRKVLIDPIECRVIEFNHFGGFHPLLGCSDISGKEWTHSFQCSDRNISSTFIVECNTAHLSPRKRTDDT
jgi:hypothetical protein